MIQSTRGMSRPRAATSVQRRIPEEALQNSKKVLVRFCCFCLPCVSNSVSELMVDLLAEEEEEEENSHGDPIQAHRYNSTTPHDT